MIEQEIKLELSQQATLALIDKLKLLNAEREFCVKQVTTRFDTTGSDLANRGVFLRTRTGEKNTVTLKRKITGSAENIKSREELEITIDDQNSIDTLNNIFKILGFDHCLIMEKYRMQWSLLDCEIAIDELPFGFYVEIEGDGTNIFKVAELLQLDGARALTETYWDLFENYKNKNGLKIGENIVFLTGHNPVITKIN